MTRGELEHRDAGGERVGGERRAQVVDPRRGRRSPRPRWRAPTRGGASCRGSAARPAAPGTAAACRAAAGARRALRARGGTAAPDGARRASSPARRPRHRDGAAHVDYAGAAVDVAALERLPLLGPQPGRGGERRQRRYVGESSSADRVDLGAREGAHRPGRRLAVAAGELRRVAWPCSPTGRRRRASGAAPARRRSGCARGAWPAMWRSRRSSARGRAAARRRTRGWRARAARAACRSCEAARWRRGARGRSARARRASARASARARRAAAGSMTSR